MIWVVFKSVCTTLQEDDTFPDPFVQPSASDNDEVEIILQDPFDSSSNCNLAAAFQERSIKLTDPFFKSYSSHHSHSSTQSSEKEDSLPSSGSSPPTRSSVGDDFEIPDFDSPQAPDTSRL